MDLSLVAFPEQCLWVNSVRGKGRSDFMPLCATKPVLERSVIHLNFTKSIN
jgi:hypothetical protein